MTPTRRRPNFILQSADHAGADWTIETKLSGTITDGYGQGGLIAYVNGDNYVKFDAISDTGQTRINRLELRSEVGGAVQNPQGNIDVPAGTAQHLAAPEQDRHELHGRVLVRRDDLDRRSAAVPNAMDAPAVRPVRLRAAGGGRRRHGVVRLLHARRAGPAERVRLHRPRRRVRRDRARHRRSGTRSCGPTTRSSPSQDGALKVTTVLGDIYTNSDSVRDAQLPPADRRPHRHGGLRPGDQGRRHPAQRRLRPGRHPRPHRRRQLREVRRDLRRRQPEVQPDRAALGAGRRDPEPAAAGHDRLPGHRQRRVAAADQDRHVLQGRVLARTARPGRRWRPRSPTRRPTPTFGLFTLGVQIADRVVGFEYFKVDGSTGCPPTRSPRTTRR